MIFYPFFQDMPIETELRNDTRLVIEEPEKVHEECRTFTD